MSRELTSEVMKPVLLLGGMVGMLTVGLFTKQYKEDPVRFPASAKNIERVQAGIRELPGIYAEIPHEDKGKVDCGRDKIVLYGVLPLKKDHDMHVVADTPTEGIDTVRCDVVPDREVIVE